MRLIVEFKIHPPACQSEFARQHVIMMQARQFARPQIKANDVRQIAAAKTSVEIEQRRFAVGNLAHVPAAAPLRFVKRRLDWAKAPTGPPPPNGVNERQPPPVLPLLA